MQISRCSYSAVWYNCYNSAFSSFQLQYALAASSRQAHSRWCVCRVHTAHSGGGPAQFILLLNTLKTRNVSALGSDSLSKNSRTHLSAPWRQPDRWCELLNTEKEKFFDRERTVSWPSAGREMTVSWSWADRELTVSWQWEDRDLTLSGP